MKTTSGMAGGLGHHDGGYGGYGSYGYHILIHPLDDAGIENIECRSYQFLELSEHTQINISDAEFLARLLRIQALPLMRLEAHIQHQYIQKSQYLFF
jgi:hypothetical protein